MTWPLRQSTAGQIVPLGPFVSYDDGTDDLVPAESLTIAATDIRLLKAGAATEVAKNSGGATHIAAGRYRCTLDATDTDTLGPLRIAVSVAGALSEWIDCCVYPAAVYDAMHAGTGDGVRAMATNTIVPPTAAAVAGQVRTELATELGRLDAPISSRSTLTAAQVWAAATRTLTAAADSAGVMTLLSRITGLLRTKAEADATDSTLLSAIEDVQADVDDLQSRPVPPTAEVISAQVATDLATAHGAGSWQTATGFATPADVAPTIEFAPVIEPTELSAASAEAITNPILVAIGQIEGGGGGMTASGVRAAIGMATANLDAQLAAILSSSGGGGTGGSGGGSLSLGSVHVVERSTTDQQPIRFPWPISGATIAVRRSIHGGAYEDAAGAVEFHRTESGVHWYSLAFNSADRPSADGEPAEGTVRYELSASGRTRYVNLRVYSAAADVDLQPVLDAITEIDPTISSDVATLIAAQLSALSIRRLTERQPLVTDVALVRGTDWRFSITVDPIPEDWTRIELTARRHNSDAQSQSLLHIVLTNPAGDGDGLQILSGSPAADRAAGAITVTDGQAIATVAAAAVASVADGEYCWDAKVTSAAGIDQIARGTLFIERDVTRLAAA